MRTTPFVALCLASLIASSRAPGDDILPDLGPVVISVAPLGACPGETLDIELSGRNLDGTREIVFARPDITAKLLSRDFFSVKARVAVGRRVPTGLHDYRLHTPQGTHVGVFHVSSLRREDEKEPNNDLNQAQRIKLPVIIDGIVQPDDYDVFRVHGEAGQTLVFDVLSTRAGTRFDSTLTLLDEHGAELEFVDDAYIQKDSHLSYRVTKTGDYFIRVAPAAEAIAGLFEGTPYSGYRLIAGVLPHMLHALPAGVRRGADNELQISGVNLEKVDRVVLGDSLATGHVVHATPDAITVHMTVPASLAPGRYPLHAFAGSLESPLELLVVVSDLEERLSTPARTRAHPQPITFPAAYSGVFDRKKASHFFSFDVQAGQRLVFDVDSMKLGFLDDPLVAIYTSDGKLLASHDDRLQQNGDEPPNLDSYLVYRFENAGRYVAMIRDCAERGGSNYVYRLAVYPAQPDFDLEGLTPALTLFRGRRVPLPARVRRFGGWSTPIEVWLENLPQGMNSKTVIAPPKDTIVKDNCALDRQLDGTNVLLPIHVSPDLPPGEYPLRLRARGVIDGRVVEHTAQILYWWERVGKVSGPIEEQKIVATVTDLPPVVLEVNHNSRPGAYEPAEFLTVSPGQSARLPILVRRYDGSDAVLTLEPDAPVEGVRFENNKARPGQMLVELKLKIDSKFKPGRFRLRSGSAVTPPITLMPEMSEGGSQ